MRSRPATALAAFVIAACQTAAPPSTTTHGPSTTTTTVATTTTTTQATTTTTDPGPILGLVTPTGVPVAVQVVLPTGYQVWTPCGITARVSMGEPLYRTPVVLDPGHGGDRDIGATGRNGLPEKVANLRVAFATQAALAEKDIPSVLTRTSDYATTLPVRSRLADHLQADALVSIHHNAPTFAPSDTPGTEIFYQNESDRSRRLGGLLYEHVVAALQLFDIQWSKAPDSGVITVINSRGIDAYGMLRLPQTPSVLLEVGYMSHPPEAELFATEEYVEVVAWAIADGIEAYLTTDRPGAGYYEPGRVFNPNPGLSQARCVDPDLE